MPLMLEVGRHLARSSRRFGLFVYFSADFYFADAHFALQAPAEP